MKKDKKLIIYQGKHKKYKGRICYFVKHSSWKDPIPVEPIDLARFLKDKFKKINQ